jgi:LPXTG-motif cell wall-anchored protein
VRDPGTTGGGTSPFAFLVGAALILLLGAGAVWRSRRSRDGAS